MTLLWRPTLAASLPIDVDLASLPYPLWASQKVDGFRAMVQHGVLVSRNGLPVPNKELQARFGRKDREGLDCELTAGPPNALGVFNATSRVVKKADAKAEHVRANVIDYMASPQAVLFNLGQRISVLKTNFGLAQQKEGWYLIKQTLIKDVEQLKSFEATCLSTGYEGVMLRACCTPGPYMQKRSTLREFNLVKLKRFDYGEARLLAVYALKHNLNSEKTATGARSSKKGGISTDAVLFGSVAMQDVKSKVEFSVSIPGDVLRSWPGWRDERQWKGKVIRYKFFPTGNVSAPRFPTATFEELNVR